MMSSLKKVIVTGGLGYIGSHTVLDLFKNDFTPVIIDNLSNSSVKNLTGINKILNSNIKWYNVDCTDKQAMSNVFENEPNIIGCIHFAAYKSVDESILNPGKYFKNNIGSLEVLLYCMKKYEIYNLIFSSSCTVYGFPDILPVNEDAPFKKPESPYAETKQICEEMLIDSSISCVSLRYFNPIGCHESSLIGDCSSDKPANLLPIVAEVANGVREKIIINGNDYNTADGTCLRDYIHVEDLASVHVKSFQFLFNNAIDNIVFNVGTGRPNSVLEIVNLFQKINSVNVNYSFGKRRAGDIEQIYSNNDKVNKMLDWNPIRSLKDAIKSEWAWQLNKNL